MGQLVLKRAAASRSSGEWSDDDYDVLADGVVVGWIMLASALDCGYPASSLKERVHALSSPDGAPDHCGILIYTATAGAQGTLGGLVGTATRFAQILEGALERSMICSNDAICADHHPGPRGGDRATHGAACLTVCSSPTAK